MQDAALRRAAELDIWDGPVSPEPLPGGISNHNFLIEDGGRRYVVRVGEDAPEHAVYRFNEVTISIAAHAAGLSPGVVHHEPDVLVLEYLDGARTLTVDDIRDPANLDRLIGLIGRCHMDLPGYLEVPGPMFWVFQVNRRYARIIAEGRARGRENLPVWMALNDRLEVLVEIVQIIKDRITTCPGHQALDTVFKCRHPRRIIARHRNAHQSDPVCIDLRAAEKIIETRLARHLVISAGRYVFEIHG